MLDQPWVILPTGVAASVPCRVRQPERCADMFSHSGATHVVFESSQDGFVYAVNAETGAGCSGGVPSS